MKNVLLIDDDSICNFINRKTLQLTGRVNTIDTALNGFEAINLFNNYYQRGDHPFPDLVLLDLNMPVMDGFDFLEEFNKMIFPKKEKVRIVVVSSSGNEEDVARAKGLGVFRYLNKPLNPHAAIEALDY